MRFSWILATVGGIPSARAETLSVSEPIGFEEVLPLGAGEWDVRGQMSIEKARTIADASVFVGLTDRLGAELTVPLAVNPRSEPMRSGFDSFEVGLRFLAIDGNDLAIGTLAGMHVALPRSDHMAGDARIELEAGLGLATRWREVGLQLACAVSSEASVTSSLSLSRALALRTDILLEAMSTSELSGFHPEVLAGPGLKVHITDRLIAAFAVFVAVTDHAEGQAIVQVQHGL